MATDEDIYQRMKLKAGTQHTDKAEPQDWVRLVEMLRVARRQNRELLADNRRLVALIEETPT